MVTVVLALTIVNIGIASAKPPLWSMPTLFLSGSAGSRIPTGSYMGGLYFVAGLLILDVLADRDGGFKPRVESFDRGSDYYKKHGVMMPEDGREKLKAFDAIYFGAVGAPDVPDHITLWGLRLNICQPFDQYANVRPTRILPGIKSPLAGNAREDRLDDPPGELRR